MADGASDTRQAARRCDEEPIAAAAAVLALRNAIGRLWRATLSDGDLRPAQSEPPRPIPPDRAASRDATSGGSRVAQLAADLRAGRVSAMELAEAALARAAAAREQLGAFVVVSDDMAIDAARRADGELAAGHDRGPLHGIPIAVKDVIDTRGVQTANGSSGLGWRVPRRDAAVWARLERAGAVLVGKTTTHELAWGATTPGCSNPIDARRSPGGSSGGSAAAVAAGVVPVALGTDTGGSVRLPAALCGVVGFRPATGSVPMAGVTPLAPTQDVVGPFATTVADCAAVADVLSGRDEPSGPADPPERFGVVEDAWAQRADPEVLGVFAAANTRLAERGLEPVPIRIPLAELAPAASYVTMLAESARLWHDAARTAPETVGGSVRALLRVGAGIAYRDHERALAASRAIRRSLCAAMEDARVSACLLPTVPVTAQPLDAQFAEIGGRRIPVDAVYVAFTALASVTGLAALSVPCGADRAGLPVGLQLIAAPGSESALWSLAELSMRPALSTSAEAP